MLYCCMYKRNPRTDGQQGRPMDSPKPIYPFTSLKLGALKMLDGRTPVDICTISSPDEHKGTGEQKPSSKVYLPIAYLSLSNAR